MDPVSRQGFIFRYVGSDAERVLRAVRDAGLERFSSISTGLPVREFAAIVKSACVNCYIWKESTFHHKLLELLAAGRPVIAYPGEHEESIRFSAISPTPFFKCSDPTALRCALSEIWSGKGFSPNPSQQSPDWRWQTMSQHLERFLLEVIDRSGTGRIGTSQARLVGG